MSEKTKSHRNFKVFATIAVLALVLVPGLFKIPIDTVRVGECGGVRPIRLSLVNGDLNKFAAAKKEAGEQRARKAEVLKKYPGLAMSCSLGPTYQLCIF